MKKLFGTDGVRGIAYEFLSYELARSVGYALGIILRKKSDAPKVIIGTDTRISKDMLKEAIAEGLSLNGATVFDIGVVPTPAVAYITASESYDAGIMISASHNPYEYNGIKIFGSKGFKLTDAEEEQIEKIVYETKLENLDGNISIIPSPELKEKYINYLKGFITADLSDIYAVIDCANGSASATAKEIFESAGMKIKFIGNEPDGKNINEACGSTHLEKLKQEVIEAHADIGIAFDGDADRCLTIDEAGNEIDGDFIMAILALALKDKGKLKGNTAVGTVMSNYGFTKFAKDRSINFVATKVGDRYVLEEIENNDYSFGGEQSGHIIIREAATTGDGQLTAIYLLNRIAESGRSLSSLASVMKKYPQHMVNIHADSDGKAAFASDSRISAVIEEAKKRLGDSGRILVRPSGTEPLVRIMVESTDPELTVKLCEEVAEKIKQILILK